MISCIVSSWGSLFCRLKWECFLFLCENLNSQMTRSKDYILITLWWEFKWKWQTLELILPVKSDTISKSDHFQGKKIILPYTHYFHVTLESVHFFKISILL